MSSSASAPEYPSPAYAWYVVGVLVLAYTFSFIDRTILTLMVGPIRKSLEISDFEISLLHGLAFAVFYTFLGIPIGWMADRYKRTRIISIGAFIWSFMTALCGLARSFGGMFMARVGVGVGEAALSPAAFSILADYFPPAKLSRALSVYSSAIYVGTGVANIAGGAIIALVPAMVLPLVGEMEPWRIVFMVVGLPGILICVLMMTVREPVRRGLIAGAGPNQHVPFKEVVQFLWRRRVIYGLLLFGYGLKGMLWNGITAWIPTHFARTYGWQAGEIGLWYGLAMIVFGTAGILTGGVVSGNLRAKGRPAGYLHVAVFGALATLPAGVIAPLMPDAWGSLAVFCVFIFFGSFPVGAAAASFQEITPNQMRAQVSALYLFGNNLIGIGLGPTLVASFTDFVFEDDAALRYSLVAVTAIVAPLIAAFMWWAAKPFAREFEWAKKANVTT